MVGVRRAWIAVSWMLLAAAGLAEDRPGRFVRLEAGDVAVGVEARTVLDYGSFQWLELDEAAYSKLRSSGLAFTEVAGAGQVRVWDYRFDPIYDGEPALPALLESTDPGAGLRLVQLAGPPRDSWLAQIESAGWRLLQYYPHHSYLVWRPPGAAKSLADLEGVRWQGTFHPAYKIHPGLAERRGRIENLGVVFFDDGDRDGLLRAIAELGGTVLSVFPAQPDAVLMTAVVRLDASRIAEVAALATVVGLEYLSPRPQPDDEMTDQILAGNEGQDIVFPGYRSWLEEIGVDGSGVIWGTTDSGVDYGHPDFAGRIVGGHNYPGCEFPDPGDDLSGHGTLVTGVYGGSGATGLTDKYGLLYGLGVAPEVSIFAQNFICGTQTFFPPEGGWEILTRRAVEAGAAGSNNSWSTGIVANGYGRDERTHDFLVRDANFSTPEVAEELIFVFSAGNSGPNSLTITSPHEAKNPIVVASTQTVRDDPEAGFDEFDDLVQQVSSFSSRGPAVDGRYVPTLAAPGGKLTTARRTVGASLCPDPIPGTGRLYALCYGTSLAAPQVSGAAALLVDWWAQRSDGDVPSPAMVKALLVNSARATRNPAPIPNFDVGWGRVDLQTLFDAGIVRVLRDQTEYFGASGEQLTYELAVVDPNRPVKVSVAWTDAPGGLGANPALVNDLDLVVVSGTATYLGNRFIGGWSVATEADEPQLRPDTVNNLENVFIARPGGRVIVTIRATRIAGDGIPKFGDATDQDFALVCSNCTDVRLSSTACAAHGLVTGVVDTSGVPPCLELGATPMSRRP